MHNSGKNDSTMIRC